MSGNKKRPLIARVLQDPLLHFLILGGLLFGAVSLWGTGARLQNEIVITKAGQKHLADLFALTWQREPSADELKNLVEGHIKEEVYYREALALGLDDNDTIVRRRLRQKLEFMQEDLSSLEEPSEDELRVYFSSHKDQYKTDRNLSFKQILVSSKKLDASAVDALQTKAKLAAGATPESLSRSYLLPAFVKLETEKSIRNTFGSDFMAQISGLETGRWLGPIYSGFGTHFVNIALDQSAKPLTFAQAQKKVRLDFIQSRREAAAGSYYKNLRSQYQITIEEAQ